MENVTDEVLEEIVLGAAACDKVFTIVNTYADPCM
jgi:hypothetical protein|tara:strand:- start:324 stop:428 length:105 start_codon:yes stop_codon:yes gene_type:complete